MSVSEPSAAGAGPRVPRRLVAWTVTMSALLVGVGVWFYNVERQRLRAEAQKDLSVIAELKVNQIMTWRAERLADAATISESPFFLEAVGRFLAGSSEDQALLATRFEAIRQREGYDEALLVDAGGVVRLSSPGRVHVSVTDFSEVLQDSLRSGTPLLTDLHSGPGALPPHLDVVAPIVQAERTLGAVILRTFADRFLYPLITSWPTPSRTAETLLVRREGQQVLFLNDLRHTPRAALSRRLPVATESLPAGLAVQGITGVVEGRDYRGVPVLADIRPVPGSPWFMIAKVDLSEALAAWRSQAVLIVALVIATVVVAGVGGTAAWQRHEAAHFRALLEAQGQQREAERRLAAIVDGSGDAIMGWSLDGLISSWNAGAQSLLGYQPDEIVGQSVLRIASANRLGAYSQLLARILSGTSPESHEESWRAKDGSWIQVSVTLSATRDELGRVSGISAIARDVSDRKRAEARVAATLEELRRSNENLEQFAYVASHDLQEPLRMVASYTQLLARRYGDRLDDDARDFIGFAVDGAQRMQRLIHDLLAFSRVTTRGEPPRPIPAKTALDEALANLAAQIEESGAKVRVRHLPTVLADHAQLVHVFQNLIANAIKFHKPGHPSSVHVHADRSADSPGWWTFRVSDDGIGIDPKYFDRLFTIFQRLHSRQSYPGSGIGLALCKRIVERHGGRIWLESEAQRGTTCAFTLPAVAGSQEVL